MTDLEKLVEKLADNYESDAYVENVGAGALAFKAGALHPMIVRAIELRERAKVYRELFEECREADSPVAVFWSERNAIAEAELAQLMAGIEEKA